MKKNILFLSTFVLGVFLLSLNQSTSVRTNRILDNSFAINQQSLNNLIPHDPIEIYSDIGLEVFPGNGTVYNPYIIENYSFDTGYVDAIFISYTTKYFVIRNCHIASNTRGIVLYRIYNGTAKVENNMIVGGVYSIGYTYGIDLDLSENTTIERNQIDSWDFPVYCDSSDYSKIRNNNGTTNRNNFRILRSPHSHIISNVFTGNADFTFSIASSEYSVVRNNIIEGIEIDIYDGMIDYSSYTIENNFINGKLIGYFYGAHDLIIDSNVFGYLFLINCYDFTVKDLSFSNLISPLKILNSWNFIIELNLFEYCTNPLLLEQGSQEGIIRNNTILNGRGGIYAEQHFHSDFYYNYFRNNSNYALNMGDYTLESKIHHNYFIDNTFDVPFAISQAVDDGNNIWYDNTTNEGNYWSNWEGNCSSEILYEIDGESSSIDMYPLNENLQSCSAISLSNKSNKISFTAPMLLIMPVVIFAIKKKMNNNSFKSI